MSLASQASITNFLAELTWIAMIARINEHLPDKRNLRAKKIRFSQF
jgi:hypothetical protein